MPEAISSIGNFLGGSGGKLLTTGLTGAGAVGNIVNDVQRGQQYSKLKQFENMTPQQLSSQVSQGTAPLNAGLVQAVQNAVMGNDAERGLAGAPGILSADLAQALAPYYQQNQNVALSLLQSKMGLPAQASALTAPTSNMSTAIAQLLKQWQTPNASAPQVSNPVNQIGPLPPPVYQQANPTSPTPPDITYPDYSQLFSGFSGATP